MAKKLSGAKTSDAVGTDRWAVPARASQFLAGGSENSAGGKQESASGRTPQRSVPTTTLTNI